MLRFSCFSLMACALIGTLSSCGGERSPGKSGHANREVNAIKQAEQQQQREADQVLSQTVTALDFEQQQLEEKANRQRATIKAERDRRIDPWKLERNQIERTLKDIADQQQNTSDAAWSKLPPEEAAMRRAEKRKKLSEDQADAAADIRAINADINEVEKAAKQDLEQVDAEVAAAINVLAQKRLKARHLARERKLQAEQAAARDVNDDKRAGVKHGDTSDAQQGISGSSAQNKNDATIVDQVQARFNDNKVGSAIIVASSDGIVSLSGEARDEQNKNVAVFLAKSVVGVRDVQENITILNP